MENEIRQLIDDNSVLDFLLAVQKVLEEKAFYGEAELVGQAANI